MRKKCCCDKKGGCCFDDETCEDLTKDKCEEQGGEYQGDDIFCDDPSVDCTIPRGACCLPDESCVDNLTEEECIVDNTGEWQGEDSVCTEDLCVIPRGACCFPDGSCVSPMLEEDCVLGGGDYQGDGSECFDGLCPEPTPCEDHEDCQEGECCVDGECKWFNSDCELGACCRWDGFCGGQRTEEECNALGGYTWQGVGTTCVSVDCPYLDCLVDDDCPPGRCCEDGVCDWCPGPCGGTHPSCEEDGPSWQCPTWAPCCVDGCCAEATFPDGPPGHQCEPCSNWCFPVETHTRHCCEDPEGGDDYCSSQGICCTVWCWEGAGQDGGNLLIYGCDAGLNAGDCVSDSWNTKTFHLCCPYSFDSSCGFCGGCQNLCHSDFPWDCVEEGNCGEYVTVDGGC